MIGLLRLLILLAFVLCAALFLWENQDLLTQRLPVVLNLPFLEIRFLPPNGPRIDAILLAAFGLGFIFAYLWSVWYRVRAALEIRRLRRLLTNVSAAGVARLGGSTRRPPESGTRADT